jgi:hypothetical protein
VHNEGVTMFDRRRTGRDAREGLRRGSRADAGSALLMVMAAAAILFVIAASVVGVVVFQQTQQNHAQAVTRSTALAQQGMEAYLTALRTNPDYWTTTPTIQGVGRDGTWTVAANTSVTPNTITAVGHDTSSGLLHVIRVEVRLESFSDYTIVSGDPLTLGSGMGDINITGNVRANSTITLKKKFTGMNAYYAVGGVIPQQNADVTARVAPVDFGRVLGLFPGMYTAARSREPWGATNLTGDPTASELEKSMAFYRDPNNAARNYWGADSANLSPAGSGNETDLVGVGVDFTNGSNHGTGLFYIRSVWPANVPTGNKVAVTRKQFIDFARKDPTWNIGEYGDLPTPGRSFSITPRGLNRNGNNVIYVGGDLDVYVKGQYSRSVTIVSEHDIYIIGDVSRASDAPTATLGLVAKHNIIICGDMPDTAGSATYTLPNGDTNGYTGKTYARASSDRLIHGETLMSPSTPSVLKIQAAMMAVTGAVIMDPEDVSAAPYQPAKRNATLKITGSIVAAKGLLGPNFADDEFNANYGGFAHTQIAFDPQLQDTPPPLFPQIGAGALKVIRWDEFSTYDDPNAGLSFPPPGTHVYTGPSLDDGSHLIVVIPPGGDSIPPTTQDNVVPLYNGEAVISLTAADNPGGAGVWKTWYTVDNRRNADGTVKVFQGDTIELDTMPPNTAATRTVDFWSMDQAGNVETTQSASFRMVGRDTLPPTTKVIDSLNPTKALPDGYPQRGDSDYTVYGDFKPKFSSVDTTDGLGAYMIWVVQDGDRSTAQGWDDPNPPAMSIPYPPAGFVTRYFEYYGIDKAGNREQIRTLTIRQHAPDIMPPTTNFDAQPVYVGDAVIHLDGIDDFEGQGLKDTWYQVDNGTWIQSRSNPTTVTVAAPLQGSAGVSHTLNFYSRDVSPNVNKEATQTVVFTVLSPLSDDITAPFTTSDAKDSYVGPAVMTLSSSDAGGVDHIFWSLDGGPQQIGTRIEVSDPWSGTVTHTISYGAVDKAGNVEIPKTQTFTITPERVAPVTATHNNDLYNGPAVFQLTAEDNLGGSGLKATWYKIDDGPLQMGTTLMGLTWVTVTGDGLHTITYYSVDNADNAELPKTTTLRIDTTPPVTTTDNTGSYAGEAVVHLTGADVGGSGIRSIHWRNEADGFDQVSNPVLLGVGTWTVDYWSIDNAGNVENFKTFQCTVTALPDHAAPTSYDDVQPYYNRSASPAIINVYSWDVQSGVQTMHYMLDGVSTSLPGKGNPPDGYQLTVSGDATHTLEYWAEDKAGNVETSHTVKSFKVDTVLPVTTCSARAGSTYWATQTFSLTATDSGSGVSAIYYSLDGAPTVKGTSIYVAASTDGYSHAHVIKYWSSDYAGNVEYPAKTVSFLSKPQDILPPTTYMHIDSTTTDSISLVLSAFDNVLGSGVDHTHYRVDSGNETIGNSRNIVIIQGSGAHTLEYWSTDYAGNIEAHKSATFNVDGMPPTTVSDARSVYNTPATIKLTAGDNAGGSGVAATLYRVDNGTVTTGTAPVTSVIVSASGTHNLEFWSIDNAGNVESPHKFASFNIDMIAPTTTSDAVGTYAGPAVVNLSAIDNTGGSGIAYTYYKIDSGARMTGASFTIAAPTSGSVWHTVYFWSVDNAGNTETQTSATFQVAAVANMTFSAMTPTPFSTVTVRNPACSVKAVADQKILSASATVDGVSSPVTLTNPGGYMVSQGYWDGGYYAEDECGNSYWVDPYWVDTSYWVPLDPNSATAAFPSSGLANGTHVLSVTFMNASGASKTASWTFTINAPADVTAPVTTSNAVAMYSAATTITLTASDEVGGMGLATTYYKLDGTQFTGTIPTTTIGVATQGQHTLQFWSTDRAGNKETTKSASFMVDWTAPTTGSHILSSYAGTATIVLTPVDNTGGSGLKYTYYQLDAGAQTVGATITVTPPLTGAPISHTVKYWSVDNAGNVETVKSATFSVSIPPDVTPPTTTSNAVALYYRPSTIALTAVDNPGGWGVASTYSKLDNGMQLTGTNPSTGGSGPHTLEFWSVDAASNIETPHKLASFTVATDTIAPTTVSNAVPSYTGTATVTLTATDNTNGWGVAGTFFTVDSGTQQTGTTIVVKPPVGAPVPHSITFWSADLAGNVEAGKTATFTVQGAPATMSYSGITPVEGAMLGVSNPTVSITGVALSAIANVTAMVDGIPYIPAITPGGGYTVSQGYWDGGYYGEDECGNSYWIDQYWVDTSYWVASNPAQVTASFATSGLASGSHTVAVTFILATGQTATKTWSFTTDVAAPTTTATVAPSYTGTATISLVASDNFGGSGVATTYYKVDAGAAATGTTIVVPNPITGPANHTIYFWSVDKVGNTESQKSASFVSNPLPDSIAPTTISDAVAAYAGPGAINLTATDNVGGWGVASISYSLDGAATQTVSAATAQVATGGGGVHTLKFCAKDRAGNTESPVKSVSYTVSVDLVAPTTTSNAQANYTGPATITLTATDNSGGWGVQYTYYKLDGGPQTSGTVIVVPDPLTGSVVHSLEFWSVDRAANEETPHKTVSFTITATPATMSFSNISPAGSTFTKATNPALAVTGQASLAITGVTAKLDGGTVTPVVVYTVGNTVGAVSIATSGLSVGSHTVAVTYTVTGGRQATCTWSFTVDTIAPTTTSSVVPTYTGAAGITLTATDNTGGSGVQTTYYKLDAGAYTVGTSVAVPAPTSGSASHTISYYSVDKVSNAETATTKTFVVNALVDTTPPTTGWTGNGWYGSSTATFSITATDSSGWGVQYIYYRLDGGPVTTGTVPFTVIGTGAEGSHTLEFWAVDFAGNSSAHQFVTWIVDLTAPVTSSNATATYTGSANVALSVTDKAPSSGIAYTRYRIDSGAAVTGTSISIAGPASGAPVSHTIYYWSADNAGNVEITNSRTFTIAALTATITFSNQSPAPGSTIVVRNPTVSVTGQATANIVSATAMLNGVTYPVTLSFPNTYYVSQGYWDGDYYAEDECGNSYYVPAYWVDTSYWVTDNTKAIATFPTSGLVDGTYTAVFNFAVTGQGQAPCTWTFTVGGPDATPPTTTSNLQSAYVGTATITLTPTDNAGGSGVKVTYYKLDGGAQTTGTVVVVAPPAYGSPVAHTIEFWSVDNLNNTETPHKTGSFTVAPLPDSIAPTTSSNATTTYTGTANITLTATDNLGGWGVASTNYRIDDGTQVAGTSISIPAPTAYSAVHHIDFWSVDRAGNIEASKGATFTVNALVDATAPTTTHNALSVYPSPSTVTLTPTDNVGGWGVANTYFKIDSGAQTTGTAVATGGEGSHTIEFWSVDKAGNVELPHKTVSYKVDMTAPTTLSNALPSYAGSANITLTPSDTTGGSGVRYTYYKIDAGSQVSGTAITVAGPATGLPVSHSISFWSVDWAGNTEVAKSATFTVSPPADVTPPTTTSNAAAFYAGPSTITLTAVDNTGGWGVDKTYYSVDGAAAGVGTAVPTGGSGAHTLRYWSTDLATNKETTKTVNYTVDMTAPTTTSNALLSYTGTATVTLTAADDAGGSGVKYTYYKLDANTQIAGTTIVVSPPTFGSTVHAITFYSVDNMNNAEVSKSATFTLSAQPDSTPPTTSSNAVATYSMPATITLTATDGGWGVATVYYNLDGTGQVGTTGSTCQVGTGGGGTHTLEFWAVDRATNTETPHKSATYYVTSDTTAPITTSNAVGYYIGSASITLSAVDTGWGVAGTYYKIDGGAQQTGTAISIAAPVSGSFNHTLTFWSVDKAGNVESTKTASFTIDAVPAVVTFSNMTPAAGATVGTSTTAVSVNAVADKNITNVTASLDGAAKTPTNSINATSALSSFTATGLSNGTHTVIFTVTNSIGAQATKTWTFNVSIQTDFTPPTTTSDAVSSYFGTATITLSANDNPGGTGVKATYYKVDGGAQTTGTVVKIAPPASGLPVSHTILFWSIDNANNTEIQNSKSFTVAIPDVIAPTTTSNALAAYPAPSTIMLTASDNDGGSGVAHTYYRLDGAATVEGTILGTGGVGNHVVEFWSVDNSGNIESPHKSVGYKVDTTAPVTTSNAQLSYAGAANITLTPVDEPGGSGVKYTYYQVDGGGQTSGTSVNVAPPTFSSVLHTVCFWSVDNAGNIETTKSATFTVAAPADTTPPTTVSDAKSTYAVPSRLTLTATDNYGGWGVANTYYRLDGSAVAIGTAIRTGGPGSHTLEFWSVDRASNEETPHKTVTYSVTANDVTPPVTTSNALAAYTGQAKISLTATDNCGVPPVTFYRVDTGADTTGTFITVAPPRGGSVTHSISYWSVDINGNVETATSKTFTVSAVPANMVFSGMTPAEGSIVNVRNPIISVTAQDTQNITDGVISIDGIDKTTSVILNNTLASASVSAYGLDDRVHSVTASFTDVLGATSVKTWTFTVAAPADGTPPVTVSNGVAAYAGTAQILLTASDEAGGMGVAYTYYKLDGGVQLTGTAPNTSVSVAAAGSHTIEFWSVDLAGNQEWPHKTVTFNVDFTPPTTLSNAQTAYNTAAAVITLSPTDNTGGSGVKTTYYRVDTGLNQTGTQITVPAPASGSGVWHTVYFWSVDNAGNTESTKSATFKSWPVPDTTPPTTASNAQANYSVPGVIQLTAADDTGGWGVANTYYRLDGGAQTVGLTIPTGGPGAHTLEFWSVDLAANEETPHHTVSYTVAGNDLIAPTTTSDAAATYPLGTGTIHLTATDNTGGSGVAHTYYRMDGGAQTESTLIGVSGSGTHRVDFWSIDWAGNVEATKTATFVVTAPDTTPPTTTSNALSSYTGTATVTLTATDNSGGSGVRTTFYRIDGGTAVPGTTIVIAPPLTGSVSHTIAFWSVDNGGYTEVEKSVTFTVKPMPDTTAPTTTSNAVASYTGQATITLAATDNTGGSGVIATYYRVDAGAQQSGLSIVVAAPASGSVAHAVTFWSVDVAGNTEIVRTVSFTVTAAAVGNATLAFHWDGYGEANLHVQNAAGQTIASTYVEGSGSDLSWYVTVPAGQAYYMVCDHYYDYDYDSEGGGYGVWTPVMPTNGTYDWSY